MRPLRPAAQAAIADPVGRAALFDRAEAGSPPIDRSRLVELLGKLADGRHSVDDVADQLCLLPFEMLGEFARVDHHRALRDELPEVILAEGKLTAQVVAIARSVLSHSDRLLVTRASAQVGEALREVIPDLRQHAPSTTYSVDRRQQRPAKPGILVVAGGTSDLPVVEEAIATAQLMGHEPDRLVDVGVAGLHRLLADLDRLRAARVLIVVAGMDAALSSVVAGLTAVPIIAVPTSTGYGASFGGLAALLAMLNACAPGVSVVNIDNGFGAGYQAALINAAGQRSPD